MHVCLFAVAANIELCLRVCMIVKMAKAAQTFSAATKQMRRSLTNHHILSEWFGMHLDNWFVRRGNHGRSG